MDGIDNIWRYVLIVHVLCDKVEENIILAVILGTILYFISYKTNLLSAIFKKTENHILAAIVITNLELIAYSDIINCRKFGFPDPQNLWKDILKAMFYHYYQ